MGKTISIIGMGMGNPDLLTKQARMALLQADLIIGATRMKGALPPNCKGEFFASFDAHRIQDLLETTEKEHIAICMSGDSGFYSGTRGLLTLLQDRYEIRVLPGISSLSYMAAQTGISWQDACVVSLHGRKDNWMQAVRSHQKTFILMQGSFRKMIEQLCMNGLEKVKVYLGMNLSYPEEKILAGMASTLLMKGEKLDGWDTGLCVVLILNPEPGKLPGSGISDEKFLRGNVPMTKSEVRALTLSRLHLLEDSVAYDIGAGTGSVSVEMAMQAYRGQIYSIEQKDKALELLYANKERFAAENMEIVEGEAPKALESLPSPDAVFIGGSKGSQEKILKVLFRKNPRVHVVLNMISLESVSTMLRLVKKYAVRNLEILQVGITRSRQVGPHHLMDGQNPVFLMTFDGPGEEERADDEGE